MDSRDHEYQRPTKRARHTPPPAPPSSSSSHRGPSMNNGSANGSGRSPSNLPPLSLSILGVEPLDEFIREVADFIHHMIGQRPEGANGVEVEAKVGVLRDKVSGQRLSLPVLVETSAYASFTTRSLLMFHFSYLAAIHPFITALCIVIMPNSVDCRFESNMSPVRSFRLCFSTLSQLGHGLCRSNINISTHC